MKTRLDEARERVRREKAKQKRHREVSEPSRNGDDRPIITVTTEEHQVNAAAIAALSHAPEVYQRGTILVRIVRDKADEAHGIRKQAGPRIAHLPQAILQEHMARTAFWVVLKDGERKRTHPPKWSVAAVHEYGEWPGIRYLEGIVEHPVLRPDGSILATPGYDQKTGLFLEPSGPIPQVPDQPSREEVIPAVDILMDLVDDFPFPSDIYRASWLASLLTPLARFAFEGPAPCFLVDANIRGVGKGLLLQVNATILRGKPFTVATYTTDQDELRKRIMALALSGEPAVLFDNLTGKFGGGVIDAVLTAPSFEDRLLGETRMVSAPLFITWYATGNNVVLVGDVARRICPIRLESPLEHPEERGDLRQPNLLEYISRNRTRFLGAALTILRGYAAADRPDLKLTPWGSFEHWSRVVRATVVWTGLPDPAEARRETEALSDTTPDNMKILLDGWKRLDTTGQGLTTGQVVEALAKENLEPWQEETKAAIEALGGKLDSRALGYQLRAHQRRVFGGWFFDKTGTLKRAVRWRVFPATSF